MDERWGRVDALLGALVDEDDALAAARECDEVSEPGIEVSPLAGRLLNLLAAASGAQRVLEFGTLAGYSAIWLARAVGPSGRVVSLELNPDNAKVARANLERAGVSEWVDIWCGPAADVTQRMIDADVPPFDLVFIDADKENLPTYLERTMALTRPGALVVIDNVVRGGRILDATSDDPHVRGVRQALAMIAADPRLEASALQTVGVKGWDGIAIARRIA